MVNKKSSLKLCIIGHDNLKNSAPPPTAFSLRKYPKKKETDIKQITKNFNKTSLFKVIKTESFYILKLISLLSFVLK